MGKNELKHLASFNNEPVNSSSKRVSSNSTNSNHNINNDKGGNNS